MSYANMDHAEWVESNNRVAKSLIGKRKLSLDKGFGAAPESLSPFQRNVMNICGMVFGGIYNAPIAWNGVIWRFGNGIAIPVRGGMATFDYNPLTALVFLCHEARIRCEIDPHNMRYLLLCFWQRTHEGGMNGRHPNLAEAVAKFREYLPADHSIVYRPQTEQQVA